MVPRSPRLPAEERRGHRGPPPRAPAGGSEKGATEAERRALKAEATKLRAELARLSAGAGMKGAKKGGEAQIDLGAPLAMAASEGEIGDLALRVRGEPDVKGELVDRGFPVILGGPGTPAIPAGSSGRLELARWLTSPDHPLTARVMVNRIWSHLFGRGLVETVDNFGLSGSAPDRTRVARSLGHSIRRGRLVGKIRHPRAGSEPDLPAIDLISSGQRRGGRGESALIGGRISGVLRRRGSGLPARVQWVARPGASGGRTV